MQENTKVIRITFQILALITLKLIAADATSTLDAEKSDIEPIKTSQFYQNPVYNSEILDNEDFEEPSESELDKRAQWNNLQGGWGKRAEWNKLSAAWGKRPAGNAGWNNLSGMWGKRAKWNELNGMWGKRGWNDMSGGWGKRTSPHWNKLRGMWGKRSAPNFEMVDASAKA